jgi:cardiolipin synthase
MIEQQMNWALYLFVIAGLTDGIDGFLARHYDWRTEIGAWLDPLADKALLVSIFVTLGIFGHLPTWLVILVVSRDVLIIGAIVLSWMMERPVRVKPLLVSKINTAAQILLATLVLANFGFDLGLSGLVQFLIYTIAATTILSALAYMSGWFKHMLRFE